ncbi:hypothetical protein LSAT2_013694 [Lamellibrachia satsuma]|nr:hypothetical protein LSAT2_013694 [Lamellibrachia satsuma]
MELRSSQHVATQRPEFLADFSISCRILVVNTVSTIADVTCTANFLQEISTISLTSSTDEITVKTFRCYNGVRNTDLSLLR